jgi:phosphatidylserine/phosphatidylglycerophosphate/cardiolipin synthase-like enzyme
MISAMALLLLSLAVSPARGDDVCFSLDEPCDQKLQSFVGAARESVDVAIYDINLGDFVELLIEKSRKIQVRIVVDRRQAKGRTSAVGRLIQAGASVRYGHQRGIMHNKFVIVDGKELETGSFNFTRHAARSNNENQVYLRTPPVVERYRKRFESIWKEATPTKAIP